MYESKIIISQLQEMKNFYLFFDILLDICFPLFKILVIGEICHKSKILELENTSLFIGMGEKRPRQIKRLPFFFLNDMEWCCYGYMQDNKFQDISLERLVLLKGYHIFGIFLCKFSNYTLPLPSHSLQRPSHHCCLGP